MVRNFSQTIYPFLVSQERYEAFFLCWNKAVWNVGKNVQAHPASSPWTVAGWSPKEGKVCYYTWKSDVEFGQMGDFLLCLLSVLWKLSRLQLQGETRTTHHGTGVEKGAQGEGMLQSRVEKNQMVSWKYPCKTEREIKNQLKLRMKKQQRWQPGS